MSESSGSWARGSKSLLYLLESNLCPADQKFTTYVDQTALQRADCFIPRDTLVSLPPPPPPMLCFSLRIFALTFPQQEIAFSLTSLYGFSTDIISHRFFLTTEVDIPLAYPHCYVLYSLEQFSWLKIIIVSACLLTTHFPWLEYKSWNQRLFSLVVPKRCLHVMDMQYTFVK